MTKSLSLIFPAYNEESNIGKLVERAVSVAKKITDDFEIIVVNDGSKDKTGPILNELTKKIKQLRVVTHPTNKGYGQAVWNGLKSAKKEWIFFSDGDLQFNLDEIKRLLKHAPKYKAVIGYRSKRQDSFIRTLNAKGWNVLNRILFGLKVKDIDCAFKIFHRDALANLDIKSGGATFSAELLLRVKRKGFDIKEVAVSHYPSHGKESTGAKPKVIIRAFRELFYLYRTSDLGRPVVKDMIKFGLTGAVSTILDVGTLNLFYLVMKSTLYWSTFAGFVAGTFNGYLMNNYWTYRRLKKRANPRDFLRLAIVGTVGLGLTQLIMFVLVEKAGLYYNYAKLFAIVVVFFWNFFGARYFAFQVHKEAHNG